MDAGVLFVVQVWRDAHGFHASVRDVRQEEATRFDDPTALAGFLAVGAAPSAASPPLAEATKEESRNDSSDDGAAVVGAGTAPHGGNQRSRPG